MKLDEVLAAQAHNQRLIHYDIGTVLVPYEHLRAIVTGLRKQRDAIAADRNLTPAGKNDALRKAAETARAAVNQWHANRLKDLDADLTAQRAALIGTVDRPDPTRIELMTSHVLKHTPESLVVFYSSATEAERREMEAASAAIGRVPLKTANGFEWKPLLDPSMVAEAQLERASQTNPTAAQRVRELSEIRDMQVTLTGVALSEI
jgi:hypothetical protein